MGWKKSALLAVIVYSFFTCSLLNIFGMQLSHEDQYYEWGILNLPAARYELFKSACVHFIVFVASLALYYYRYSDHAHLNSNGFVPIN